MAGTRKTSGGFQGEIHAEGRRESERQRGGCGRQTRIRWEVEQMDPAPRWWVGEQQGRADVLAGETVPVATGGGAAGRFLSDGAGG